MYLVIHVMHIFYVENITRDFWIDFLTIEFAIFKNSLCINQKKTQLDFYILMKRRTRTIKEKIMKEIHNGFFL